MNHGKLRFLVLLAVVGLAACGGDDDDTTSPGSGPGAMQDATYRVEVTNITANQPLTPIGVVIHGAGYTPWQVGQPASVGLEKLAESGDPAAFLEDAAQNPVVISSVGGTDGPFGPGGSQTVTFSVKPQSDLRVSVATMLANTNDGFAGVNGVGIGALAVGEHLSVLAHAHDAGTEANTEAFGTIPGPADGGEGFNAARSDNRDFVSIHSGVVTQDDGLMTSVLNESHRWLGDVAVVSVTRTQ